MRAKLIPLLKDASHLFTAQALGVGISFIISILVARHLGAEGRGAYGWIMALHFLALQFGQVGTDTLNRKLAATKPNLAAALAANSALQAVILGVLSVTAFYAYGILQPTGQLYPFALLVGLAAAPFAILGSTWNGLAAGLGQARILARSEIIQRLTIVTLVLLFLTTTTLQVWHLMAALILGIAAAAAYTGWNLHNHLKGRWKLQPSLFKHEKNFIITAFGAGLAIQLVQRMDLLMLAAWRPLAEAGYFAIAQTLIDAMLMLPGALAFMLLPKMAAETDALARTKFLLTVLAGAMAATAAMCVAAALVAPFFIPLLFGEEFAASVPVFQRLLVAGLLFAGFTICQNAVSGYRRARYIIVAPLVGVLLKLSIGWLIIPHGMLAAANASILAYGGAFAMSLFLAVYGTFRARPNLKNPA